MSMTDPVADLLTRVRNASKARKPVVDVPASNLKREIVRILKDNLYVRDLIELLDNKMDGRELTYQEMGALQAALADVFPPFRVDLVPLDRVDPLFQFAAVDGIRVAAPDSTAADDHELLVMRRAADLLPFQRELEIERFGVATT